MEISIGTVVGIFTLCSYITTLPQVNLLFQGTIIPSKFWHSHDLMLNKTLLCFNCCA